MAIRYPVGPGTLLLCNYDTGFREPEMVKRRPVVVVSPRLPYRDNLCAVVPLSLTAPGKPQNYHCQVILEAPLPSPWDSPTAWIKGDMIATVCYSRLDLFQTSRDHTGRRKYLHPKLNLEQMKTVHSAILHGIGLRTLTFHL